MAEGSLYMLCPIRPLTLSVLLEHQLPLLRLILVLSTPPVLSSFTCGQETNNLIPLEKTVTNQWDLNDQAALILLLLRVRPT